MKFTVHRPCTWVLITVAAAISVGVLAPTATATPPVMETVSASGSSDIIGFCSFPIQFSFSETLARTNFFDQNGNLTRRHTVITEQDTFSANGKTLTSEPYSVSVETYFENGEVASRQIQGVGERVPLPGGGVYIVAGQTSEFGMVVDHGTNGDVSAFCGALS